MYQHYGGFQNIGKFSSPKVVMILLLKVKPDDENFVFVGGTNLYSSSDGFATSTNSKWIGGYSGAKVI